MNFFNVFADRLHVADGVEPPAAGASQRYERLKVDVSFPLRVFRVDEMFDKLGETHIVSAPPHLPLSVQVFDVNRVSRE